MRTFNDFSDAFDYCRELGAPVTVEISGVGQFKLYPSGKAERVMRTATHETVLKQGAEAQE